MVCWIGIYQKTGKAADPFPSQFNKAFNTVSRYFLND
jgi:hypothetical protein